MASKSMIANPTIIATLHAINILQFHSFSETTVGS
jgi:hypothetical protein